MRFWEWESEKVERAGRPFACMRLGFGEFLSTRVQ